jgi:hypothetical protein
MKPDTIIMDMNDYTLREAELTVANLKDAGYGVKIACNNGESILFARQVIEVVEE